jgi:hypothetical protein
MTENKEMNESEKPTMMFVRVPLELSNALSAKAESMSPKLEEITDALSALITRFGGDAGSVDKFIKDTAQTVYYQALNANMDKLTLAMSERERGQLENKLQA